MLRALYSSAAGMQSQQMNLDVIANNLANVNTAGFKKSKIEFQDMLYQTAKEAGAEQGGGKQLPTGLQIGHGAQAVATARVFTNGEFQQTDQKYDIAIDGDGFFEVLMPDGRRAYTRSGTFKTAQDGSVSTTDGLAVQGGWQPIAPGTISVSVAPNGEVTTDGGGGKQTFRLQLTRFANPGGLKSIGRNLYLETDASGTPETGNPDENGFGSLRQGWIELSNVKIVEEMVNMIIAQRAYEVNSKAVQSADEMMQMSNNLRR